MASDIYNKKSKDITKQERNLGKMTILGSQYLMGWKRFQINAKKDYGVILTDDEAKRLINLYRTKFRTLVAKGRSLHKALATVAKSSYKRVLKIAKLKVWYDKEDNSIKILLPNKSILYYRGIKTEFDKKYRTHKVFYITRYMNDGQPLHKELIPSTVINNVIQCTAGYILKESVYNLEQAGYRVKFTVHDEIIVQTDDNSEATAKAIDTIITSTDDDWKHGLPLQVEGHFTKAYGKF